MATDNDGESVGLKGAKAIGDKRVSTLLDFSWASVRSSGLSRFVDEAKVTPERSVGDAEQAVQRGRRRKAS
jgi:hypothetical protein